MRCVNCGWDNKNPNASSCEKCGHPLPQEPTPAPAQAPQGDPYSGVNVPNYNNEAMPRPTVINTPRNQAAGNLAAGNPVAEQPAQPAPTRVMNSEAIQAQMKRTVIQGSDRCPQCGFNLPANAVSCPNCGMELVEQQEEPTPVAVKEEPVYTQPAQKPEQPAVQTDKPTTVMGHTVKPQTDAETNDTNVCDKCGTVVPGDVMICPTCGERIRQKTVIVRRKPKAKEKVEEPPVKCQLILIPEEDEGIEATVRHYEGKSVILNRDNTEPDNRTITSKQQAEMTCEDGKWYIENRSALGSTYVQANRKIEVQPGDIIVLGDRRFKFETKTENV